MIVMSFHGINFKSCSIHTALSKKVKPDDAFVPHFSPGQWKTILLGVISAINHLHAKQILHNDIKHDNVVVDEHRSNVRSVLVDFGKACYELKGKKYNLTESEKAMFKSKHPQIAPDLRDGHCKQTKATDIYSFGRIISSINEEKVSLPILKSLSEKCLDYRSGQRPSTTDLFISFTNLFCE